MVDQDTEEISTATVENLRLEYQMAQQSAEHHDNLVSYASQRWAYGALMLIFLAAWATILWHGLRL